MEIRLMNQCKSRLKMALKVNFSSQFTILRNVEVINRNSHQPLVKNLLIYPFLNKEQLNNNIQTFCDLLLSSTEKCIMTIKMADVEETKNPQWLFCTVLVEFMASLMRQYMSTYVYADVYVRVCIYASVYVSQCVYHHTGTTNEKHHNCYEQYQ